LPSAKKGSPKSPEEIKEMLEELRSEMLLAAENLEFEKAAQLRDRIKAAEAGLDGTPANKESGRATTAARPGRGRGKRR
jgi:excinuclease ABC subunit B